MALNPVTSERARVVVRARAVAVLVVDDPWVVRSGGSGVFYTLGHLAPIAPG